MIRRVAEYTIREGELEVVEEAVRRFVAAVRSQEPATTYEAYRLGDGLSFLHFMAFPDEEAERAHQRAQYTTDFVDVLYPHCLEAPRFTELAPVEPE